MTATVLTIIALLFSIVSLLMKQYYAKQEAQQTPQAKVDKNDNDFTQALAGNDNTTITAMFNDVLPKGNDANTNCPK
jgi:hypothetical protein